MNKDRFEEAVSNMAHQRVVDRITKFRAGLRKEVDALFNTYMGFNNEAVMRAVLASQDCESMKSSKWPAVLWENERERVRKELFDLMDPVQKALNAPPPSPDDPQPDV